MTSEFIADLSASHDANYGNEERDTFSYAMFFFYLQ